MRVFVAIPVAILPLLAQMAAIEGIPADALIVETQPLPAAAHPDRALVLWMEQYQKIDNHPPRMIEPYTYTCPEWTTGSGFYRGPTRIALVDVKTKKVINTVHIASPWSGDSFDVPFRIAREPWGRPGYYEVPDPLVLGEGMPRLLALKDYNGDGLALEAAFFYAEACMGLPTTLVGYSIRQDRVIQYAADIRGLSQNGRSATWVDYLFAERPVRPGHWKYTIDYSGRAGPIEDFEVRYDREHERFTGTVKTRPGPP
jgi:hypothetical protein